MVSDVLIFGAGSYARKLAKVFKAEGSTVHLFITGRQANTHPFDNIPLHDFAAFPRLLIHRLSLRPLRSNSVRAFSSWL